MENLLLIFMPSLSLKDVENMSLKEIEKRIVFFNKTKKETKNVELKNFMSIIHLAISAGSNPSRKNNKIFHDQLNKFFDNSEIKPENNQSLEDLMEIVNVKK